MESGEIYKSLWAKAIVLSEGNDLCNLYNL